MRCTGIGTRRTRLAGFARRTRLAGFPGFTRLTRFARLANFLGIARLTRLTLFAIAAIGLLIVTLALRTRGLLVAILAFAAVAVIATVATTVAIASATAAIAVAVTIALAARRLFGLHHAGDRGFGLGAAGKEGHDLAEEAAFIGRRGLSDRRRDLVLDDRCRRIRSDALYGGFDLDRLGFGCGRRRLIGLFDRLFRHLVAGQGDAFGIELVVAQADDFVGRGFQVTVGHDHQIDAVAHFDARDVDALLVEQEGGDIDRDLAVQGAGVFLH